ncbi:hypothetical protein [Paenibacillus glacialis]|uniref:Uncharacterized protein n=1 Tax=Paenibacillus glacialis TaxID=494026 RepID=A0A168FCP8_9BACL|nr:hypothetical protein [Paenibacillus glacialis]OAB36089.1 hypothetical protein PGLA_21090 [Paenibacillus glacialis]
MEHGKLFVEEFPEVGELIERLFIKRELDEWYRMKCAEILEVPNEFNEIGNLKQIESRNRISHSTDILIHLHDISGKEGFLLGQQINVKISKLFPIYILDYSYSIRHNLIEGIFEIDGTAESLEMIQATNQINRIMTSKGYTEISHLYDYYDTVCEWDVLPNIEPFNRRLTLGDALFTDVLELC